jgi:hypothetical protein
MTDLDAILARLERLESENAALRLRLVGASHDVAPGQGAAAPVAVSRRQLLRRAGAAAAVGVAAATVATIGRAEPTRADGGSVMVGSIDDTAHQTTGLVNKVSDDTVFGTFSEGAGTALYGRSAAGVGVSGLGERGGTFTGVKANVRLVPALRATHPHKGSRGDLIVDESGRLWYCKGSTSWKQLA